MLPHEDVAAISRSPVSASSATLTAMLLSLPASALPSEAASLISASLTASPSSVSSVLPSQPGVQRGECKLLGPFALFVQGALGILALSSLVFKRWRERPQRPVKIWAFDASKQVVGSALLHVANLLMSMVSSGELATATVTSYAANPCSFYLLNLAIDTTLGIPILIVLLRILTHAFALTPFGHPRESIQSGNYGHPPQYKWWLKQCFVYFIGLLGMKLCVFLIFRLCPWLVYIGDWALRWTEGDERLQVFFVMLFFPLIMNALQYYIIDGFIKDQNPSGCQAVPNEDVDDEPHEDGNAHAPLQRHQSFDSGDGEAILTKDDMNLESASIQETKPSSAQRIPGQVDSETLREYNPDKDGVESSNRNRREVQDGSYSARNQQRRKEDYRR